MKEQIDYARIFRAAMNMEPGKARHLLSQVAAAATNGAPQKDMSHMTGADYAKHYAKRKFDIHHLHRELNIELRNAQAEMMRKIRRQYAHANIKSAEGDDLMFDPETLADDLGEVLRVSLPEILVSAGQDVLETFDPPPDEAKAFITDRENLMRNVSQETFDSVKAELQEGLDAGESYRELAKRLSAKFEEITTGRAETTAMTEVASAYGYARNEAMKQSGAKYKVWVGSGRPPGTLHGMRPAHAAAHYEGQTRPFDEPFTVGGQELMFPTDSSLGAGPEMTINCHCVALPAEAPIAAGDLPGHEFHGNQWVSGEIGQFQVKRLGKPGESLYEYEVYHGDKKIGFVSVSRTTDRSQRYQVQASDGKVLGTEYTSVKKAAEAASKYHNWKLKGGVALPTTRETPSRGEIGDNA